MDKNIKIGVGITTRNRPRLIRQCVENIQKYASYQLDIVVVDDASEIPVKLDNILIHRFDKNVGIPVGKNKCLELLDHCDHIFLFDDDCWPIKNGWEDLYIQNSVKTNCHHFNFIWDTYDSGEFESSFQKISNFHQETYVLQIDGYEPEYLDKWIHDITIRMKKVQLGLSSDHPHTLTKITKSNIIEYLYTRGVMMYIDKLCLRTIGGFDTSYGLYGGAHAGFTSRAHNAGLTPFGRFIDIENSCEYFYSEDKMNGGKNINLSVLSLDEKNIDNSALGEKDRVSSHFVAYKPKKASYPGISIIVTAYKTQDFIEECLDSIQAQTYFNETNDYEILVGVDNCIDTLTKVRQIKHKYKNIRIIFMQQNYGTYITSNTLISLCKYDYILRFDSDDIMNNNMVDMMMNFSHYDVVRCQCRNFSSYCNQDNIKLSHGIILIKKEIMHKLGGYKPWPCSADKDFTNRSKMFNIKDIYEVLFKRRIHPGALTRNPETNSESSTRKKFNSMLSESFEYVSPVTGTFNEIDKPKICFIYDVEGWAFYNMSVSIKNHLESEYVIDIIRYDQKFDSQMYDLIICFSPNVLPKYVKDHKNMVCGVSSHKKDINKLLTNFENVFTNDKKIFDTIHNSNKFYIPNGIDTTYFKSRSKKNIGKQISIGTVGSKQREKHKGKHRVEKIVSLLTKLGFSVKNVSIFPDPFSQKLSQEEMVNFYNNLDIFIMSSESETGPNTLLESLSMGIPVVVNDTGLAKDLIQDGINGYIVEDYEDVECYVRRIKILIENTDIYNKFSHKSQEMIKEFDWSVKAIGFKDMINKIISQK